MYRAQYIVTVDYEKSNNPDAQKVAHYDFLAFTRHRLSQVMKTMNEANYNFKIKNILVDKVTKGG